MNKLHLAITLVAGFGFVTCIRFLARRGRLSMRYTLGWLLIGLMFLLYPIIVIAADEISDFLGVQQLAIFLGAPMIILVMVCVQLSISVSGLTEHVRTLTESIALLEQEQKTNFGSLGHEKESGSTDL
jgi:hypothetical protein